MATPPHSGAARPEGIIYGNGERGFKLFNLNVNRGDGFSE